jgi:AraC-like DNA-binding protein
MIDSAHAKLFNDLDEQFNPRLDYVGYYAATSGLVSEPKDLTRDLVNFWFVTEGNGSVKVDGQWLDFSTYDLITIKPGQNYCQEKAGKKNPFKVYFVQFYPFHEYQLPVQELFDTHWPSSISLRYYPEAKDIFMECFEIFNTRNRSNSLIEKSILFRIMYMAMDAYQNLPQEHASTGYDKFIQAKDYIDHHYTQPLTLEHVAEVADLSSSYLSSLFTKFLKTSPINYQIEVKLKKSRLLLAKGVSVTKVSDEIGFNSLHHFSRVFKKQFGIPPSQFAIQRRRK